MLQYYCVLSHTHSLTKIHIHTLSELKHNLFTKLYYTHMHTHTMSCKHIHTHKQVYTHTHITIFTHFVKTHTHTHTNIYVYLGIFVVSFFLGQYLLSISHQRKHVVVLGIILHGGEVHRLVGQHAVGLLPAITKARFLSIHVSLHLHPLIGQFLGRFRHTEHRFLFLLLERGCVCVRGSLWAGSRQ